MSVVDIHGMASTQAPLVATLGLGFLLGLKHALEADHLVAVTTIVGRHRSLLRSSLVGAWWGIGHTSSLFVASLLVMALRRAIPARAATAMEAGVGLMLIVLGLDLLLRLLRGELALHAHEHDGHNHLHVHVGGGASDSTGREHHHHVGARPFLVGLVHGLAGSAALTLVVLSTIASVWSGLAYVLVFGVGTIIGMFLMSAIVGLPFVLAARVASRLAAQVQFVAAVASVAFGCWYSFHVLAS